MVQAIIFDCFGVLTADLWKEFVASLPGGQQQPASDLNRAYDSGHLTRDEFLQEIEALTGSRPAEVEKLLNNEIIKNTALLVYIAELKRHYKIGLLSNIASDWITRSFLSDDEQRLFDALVFSYQIGATKHEAAAFEITAERLTVPLSACVMIDDNENFCAKARALGMQAICYRDFPQLQCELAPMLTA